MVLVQTLYIADVLGGKPKNLPEDNAAENSVEVLPTCSRTVKTYKMLL